MQRNLKKWDCKTDCQIYHELAVSHAFGGIYGGTINIQYDSQVSDDADSCTGNPCCERPYQLGFDIAENLAIPPVLIVIVRPEDGVDECHEIDECDVKD